MFSTSTMHKGFSLLIKSDESSPARSDNSPPTRKTSRGCRGITFWERSSEIVQSREADAAEAPHGMSNKANRPPEKALISTLEACPNSSLGSNNSNFLKDPVLVNALFLKSPKRIEALGLVLVLVLVLALLIRRLMERTMRMHPEETESTVAGWDNRRTSRPTSFMMTTKFKGIFFLTSARGRSLAQPLTSVQMAYLAILEIVPQVFVTPPG